jgi:hypothetical protein
LKFVNAALPPSVFAVSIAIARYPQEVEGMYIYKDRTPAAKIKGTNQEKSCYTAGFVVLKLSRHFRLGVGTLL